MLKQLTLASLFILPLTSIVVAAPDHPAHPARGCTSGLTMPDDRCPPTGPALFEIASVERTGDADHQNRKVLSTTKVYTNGAWTVEGLATPRTATGYLDAAVAKEIANDLSRAKWQRLYTQPPCPPPPAITTEFLSNGKSLWVEPSCAVQLDADSAKLLAHVRTLVDAAVAPPPPVSCTPSGTPLVELEDRDRTTAIYSDGSWTRDAHPNGALVTSPGAHQQHCFAKDVVAKIEADIKAASWMISHPVHCMAVSSARTIVKINGKVVFTERMCNPDALDDTSARLLAEIERLVDASPTP